MASIFASAKGGEIITLFDCKVCRSLFTSETDVSSHECTGPIGEKRPQIIPKKKVSLVSRFSRPNEFNSNELNSNELNSS